MKPKMSPEARALKAAYDRKYWLKKASEAGIDTTNEDWAIKEAKSQYRIQYWERKVQESKQVR